MERAVARRAERDKIGGILIARVFVNVVNVDRKGAHVVRLERQRHSLSYLRRRWCHLLAACPITSRRIAFWGEAPRVFTPSTGDNRAEKIDWFERAWPISPPAVRPRRPRPWPVRT